MTNRPSLPSVPGPRPSGEPHCIWQAGAQLGEGALWSQGGQCLWWVDILGRRLHRLDGLDDSHSSWAFEDEVSAVAEWAGSDALLLTTRRGFARFDPSSGALRYLHRPEQEPAGNRFNDGKCDAHGRLWAGSMDFACVAPTGALYSFEASGRCTRHADGFAVTNGPTWSIDGLTMYFNDTVAGIVLAYDFDVAAGTISNRRNWLRFGPGDGLPDGMTTDADGRLWIAHWGAGCVTCHDPGTAEELHRISLPVRQVTSCAFGGAGLRTLFITSAATGLDARQQAAQPLAGGLFSVALDAGGNPAHPFDSSLASPGRSS